MGIPVRRLVPLLVVLGCVVAGSVLGAVVLPAVIARFEDADRAAAAPPKPEPGRRGIPLDEPIKLTVNLKDAQGRRVLQATMVFEARDEAAKKALTERKTEIQHHLISMLSDKRLEDVEGKQQKDLLLRTIRLTVNERVGIPDAVLHVYFIEFIIQ